MKKKKLPYAYLTFSFERDRFRDAKNIKTALEAELYFLVNFFVSSLPDNLPSILIKNWHNLVE